MEPKRGTESQRRGIINHHSDVEIMATIRYDLGRRFYNSIRGNTPISGSLHSCRKKETKRDWDVKEISETFEQPSSHSVGTHPHQRRSNLKNQKGKSQCAQKKLDSFTFECHLDKLWRCISEEQRASFTYLDSLWFYLYLKATSKEKVLSWIKRRHIFSKKYVFVPIVCWGHWSLLIFCHFDENLESTARKPCMILLDSLQMADPRRLEPNIRNFVQDIYRAEGIRETKYSISKIPLLIPKVPQQKSDECGRFVLYFIRLFMEAAPENFSISEGYPYFMNQDWFTRESFEQFCKNLDGQLVIEDHMKIPGLHSGQPWEDDDIIVLDE